MCQGAWINVKLCVKVVVFGFLLVGRVEGPFWARPPKGGTEPAPLGRVESIGGGFQSLIRRSRHSAGWLSLKWVHSHRRGVHVSLEGPKPLTIWAQLHQCGSNLVVGLRAGSGPLGSVECAPQNFRKPRVSCSAARDLSPPHHGPHNWV